MMMMEQDEESSSINAVLDEEVLAETGIGVEVDNENEHHHHGSEEKEAQEDSQFSQTDDDDDEYFSTEEMSEAHSSDYIDVDDYEEDDDAIILLLQAPNPHLDVTMRLSEEEHGWACQLKTAVLDHSTLSLYSWTDMELAQFALVSQGDSTKAIGRMIGMQTFRETYKVDHSTIAQGLQAVEQFMQQQMGHLLCIDVDPITWEGLRVTDVGALNSTAALACDESWRQFIVGDYYLYYSSQPTLATIRQGCYTMIDYQTFGWQQWNIELQYRFCEEMFQHYPIKFSKLLCFNTGLVANLCWSLVRRFYPQSPLSVLQLGCRVPLEHDQDFPQPLRVKYLQPNLHEAYQLQLRRIQQLLELRAKNERLFRL